MRNLFFAVIAAAFCLFSCQNEKPAPKMTGLAGSMQDSTLVRLWPNEIDSLKKADPNLIFVDVRTEEEFKTSHIYRALSCYGNAPDFDQRIMKLGVGATVVLYDHDSSLSLQVAEKMRKLGFKRVYELCGGLFSWAREGKTLVSGESKIDSSIVL